MSTIFQSSIVIKKRCLDYQKQVYVISEQCPENNNIVLASHLLSQSFNYVDSNCIPIPAINFKLQ